MTNIPDSSNPAQDYPANVALSYDYIEKSLKEVQEINNNINNQLGLLIGFNFTFMRFFLNELADKIIDANSMVCYTCFYSKTLAYGFAAGSIIFCFFGLYKTVTYYIIPPKLLLENCDQVPNQELRLAVIDTWQKKLDAFNQINQQKKQIFNRSIILLFISGAMAILNKLIALIFY